MLGGALLLAACGSGSEAGEPVYDLTEFAINGPETTLSDGGAIRVTNSGEFPHTLVISDSTGQVVAGTDLIQPGEAVELDIALPPGEFQFTCRIVAETPDGDLVDHFEAGMSETVVVEG